MEELTLVPMTRELYHRFFRAFENDPALFPDGQCPVYIYEKEKVNRLFDSRQVPDRMSLALCLGGAPIGEIQLKRIDYHKGECTMGIHLQRDAVKGKGYGRRGEELALAYALDTLGLRAVNADTLSSNARSRHVLERVGFRFLGEEQGFCYYRYEREES